MMDLLASVAHSVATLPPLAPIALLLFIHNLLPAAPGEQDVWARSSAADVSGSHRPLVNQ